MLTVKDSCIVSRAETIRDRIDILRGQQDKAGFAEKIGVNASTVSRWLAEKDDQRRDPQAVHLQQLVEKLGISGHWLLTGQGDRYQTGQEWKFAALRKVLDAREPSTDEMADLMRLLRRVPKESNESSG